MKGLIYLFILIILISSASALLNNASLMAYYPLDNVSDTKDSNPMTSQNFPDFSRQGKLGKALYLNSSDDYIYRADDADFEKNTFTINCWFKKTGDEGGGGSGGIITKDTGGGSGGRQWSLHVTDAEVLTFKVNTGTAKSLMYKVIDNLWYMASATYDGANMKIYINGTLKNTTAYTGNIVAGSDAIQIGHYYFDPGGATTNIFNGYIDECAYFAYALNQSDITFLYNSYNGCNPTNTSCDLVSTPTPTLTLATSLQSYQNSKANPFYIYFNGTVANTRKNNYNCSLYKNGVYNTSIFPTDITVNQNFNFSTTNLEQVYSFNVSCKNTNTSASFTKSAIYIDTVTSVVIPYRFIQGQTYYKDTDYFLNISLFDNNLTSWTVNIFKNNSGVISSILSLNNASATADQTWVNLLVNSSGWCTTATCYFIQNTTASDVLNTGRNTTYFSLVTTPTPASNGTCNLTETNALLDDLKEDNEMIAYAIIVLGVAFFFYYVGKSINEKDDQGNAVTINVFLKWCFSVMALFVSFIAVQLVYGMALSASASTAITSNLQTLYQVVMWMFIMVGILVTYGMLFNFAMRGYQVMGTMFKRKNAKR